MIFIEFLAVGIIGGSILAALCCLAGKKPPRRRLKDKAVPIRKTIRQPAAKN